MKTPEEMKKELGMGESALDYLELKQKAIIDNIWALAQSSEPQDAVKLKANTVLLNKLVPDRTKMELDLKSQAPYEMLKKALEEK